MVTPRPPSITTNVVAEPSAPAYSSGDVVFIVGPPGAGASGTGAADEQPSPPSGSLSALTPFIGTDGVTYDAVKAILDQVSTSIIVALTPASPTHAQYTAALEKSRRASQRITVMYAPGGTHDGASLGTLSANITAAATTITLSANLTAQLPAETILQIGTEYVTTSAVALSGQTNITVRRGQEGTVAATHTAGDTVTDIRNPVVTTLERLCEEQECVAVADAPHLSVAAAMAWSDAGNTKANVMAVFNRVNSKWPGGYWLGAALKTSAQFGRQRGIEFSRVRGHITLEFGLSHSPRASVVTDVSSLVGKYISTLALRNGQYEIIGDTFKGVTDARRLWSVARVIQHLERLLEATGEHYFGMGITPQRLQSMAGGLERAGRVLVTAGELADLSIVPHPTDNTQAAREGGTASFLGVATTLVPLDHIILDLVLRV